MYVKFNTELKDWEDICKIMYDQGFNHGLEIGLKYGKASNK